VAPDEPATDVLPEQAAPAAPATSRDLTGRTLGKFTIVEQLGKGGSGDVYRAEQPQLGRSVVVKVLRHEVAWAPNRVERFLREAKLASRLDHPYAAHIYAFGAEADSTLWIAMEHVKGVTLDDLVSRRGGLPALVFAPLFARLCEVVHTAHELGIVHRDIKGSNVMVIERAGQLLPKLLDFGIAKGEDGAPSPGVDGEPSLTGHGVLGSPHYMSPEQWERPADVDSRADIYALGVLAYRCSCGYLPFRSLDRRELAHAHLQEPPPPLPELVPPGISDAIYRALAKEPDARWPTAIAFSEAIQRAANTATPETVPLFDPGTRDAWLRAGPQPIADAIAHLAAASTTVEADAAVRELVAITCRWLAVLALAGVPESRDPEVRERARAVVGRDDAAPWLQLARAAVAAAQASALPGLVAALAGADALAALAARLDDRDRVRTAAGLASDIASASEALHPLEPLLAYQLVLGLEANIAESWQGPRRRDRERVMVWGTAQHGGLAPGEVALLDGNGEVVARLSPLAQVIAPLPSAEPELFLLWRSGRGPARLVAAPWGFERDDEAAGQRLHALSTEDSDTQHDVADDRSPYPGLAAYGADDAERFFGREREIEALANRLVRSPLLAVLGPSGVGKSSFLHAGLVPRLGEHYRVLTMRPGRHPMHALAGVLPVGVDSHDERGIIAKLRELGETAPRGLVIVVDQLEELVTLCTDRDERRTFAQTLAGAADGPAAPVRVVASLRDDFATVIEGEDGFRGRFDVFVIATPPPEALRRIVIEPARRAAIKIDASVVEDMVAEVAGRPASLPLLSFTASQLWLSRDKVARTISHESYTALGGVAGALATYADEIYASLGRRDQDTVRDLFARLVAADGTRVPWPRRELEEVPGARAVLAHLVDARLLVVRDGDGPKDDVVVEIVHECLAERWPRLARWRSEDAADRALLGDVRAAARRWEEAGRRGDLLWRGAQLSDLRKLAARSTALTALERAFADSALAAQQRARRIRRGIVVAVMAVLATVAGVMAYLSSVANDSRERAQRDEARARDAAKLAEDRLTASLFAQGKRELNDGRALQALVYLAEAMRRGTDSTGLREMVSIASRGWRDILLVEHDISQSAITGSPDGWIAAGDSKGHVRWWSDTGKLVDDVDAGIGVISTLHVVPGGGVCAAGRDGIAVLDAKHHVITHIRTERVWIANPGPAPDEVSAIQEGWAIVYGADGTKRRSVRFTTDLSAEPRFDPHGGHFLFWLRGELSSVDLSTMKIRSITKDAFSRVSAASDGSVFGYLDGKRNVHLIHSDGTEVKVITPTVHGGDVEISPTGDRIGVISDRQVEVFDRSGKAHDAYYIEGDENVVLLRGEEMWTSEKNGILDHYRAGRLVASVPVAVTDLMNGALGGDAVGMLASDSTLYLVRASATQYSEAKPPCEDAGFGADGIATVYSCADGTAHVYVGRHLIGVVPDGSSLLHIAYAPVFARGAISSKVSSHVFDDQGKELAKSSKHYGAIAFEDADHLLLVQDHGSLWRWTISTDAWQDVHPVPEGNAIETIGPHAYAIGTESGTVIFYRDDHEVRRLELGSHVTFLVASNDRRWLAVQLVRGDTVIVDTASGEVARTLEAADSYGAAATFDPSGDLLLRTTRGATTIWDRATGEDLVFGLDLLRYIQNAHALPDGRIETGGAGVGLLDIPRDTRPTAEIVQDIACRVPLKVNQSRLEPTTPACKHP
jgi:tRNA A-37 threonylcarbamoyl transferase component Bud32